MRRSRKRNERLQPDLTLNRFSERIHHLLQELPVAKTTQQVKGSHSIWAMESLRGRPLLTCFNRTRPRKIQINSTIQSKWAVQLPVGITKASWASNHSRKPSAMTRSRPCDGPKVADKIRLNNMGPMGKVMHHSMLPLKMIKDKTT